MSYFVRQFPTKRQQDEISLIHTITSHSPGYNQKLRCIGLRIRRNRVGSSPSRTKKEGGPRKIDAGIPDHYSLRSAKLAKYLLVKLGHTCVLKPKTAAPQLSRRNQVSEQKGNVKVGLKEDLYEDNKVCVNTQSTSRTINKVLLIAPSLRTF